MKTRIIIFISVLVLLSIYFFVYIFSNGPYRYEIYNSIIRLTAPNFILPLDTLERTDKVFIIDEYKRRGYKLKCYGNLRSEEKISKTDDYVCWGIIKSAYDNIPAKKLSFFFSKNELHHIRIEFPHSSFEKLKEYLERRLTHYQRLDQIPGMESQTDVFGKPLITWIVRQGYITTSNLPTPNQPIILLWTNRSSFLGFSSEEEYEIKNTEDFEKFITYYYQQPNPRLVFSAIAFMQQSSIPQRDAQEFPLIGFFAEVFAKNKKIMPFLKMEIERTSGKTRKVLEFADKLSQRPESLTRFDSSIAQPWMNDICWGAFFASGNPVYLDAILARLAYLPERKNLMLYMTASSAQWSLASNALQHIQVKQYLETTIQTAPDNIKKAINEALNKSPEEIHKSMSRVLKEQHKKKIW